MKLTKLVISFRKKIRSENSNLIEIFSSLLFFLSDVTQSQTIIMIWR